MGRFTMSWTWIGAAEAEGPEKAGVHVRSKGLRRSEKRDEAEPMASVLTLSAVVFLFLFVEAFLSGAEIAMVSADRKRLSRFANAGPRPDD